MSLCTQTLNLSPSCCSSDEQQARDVAASSQNPSASALAVLSESMTVDTPSSLDVSPAVPCRPAHDIRAWLRVQATPAASLKVGSDFYGEPLKVSADFAGMNSMIIALR